MRAETIDGKAVAATVNAECRARVESLKARGVTPGIAVVIVGENPASRVYVRNKDEGRPGTGHAIGDDRTARRRRGP